MNAPIDPTKLTAFMERQGWKKYLQDPRYYVNGHYNSMTIARAEDIFQLVTESLADQAHVNCVGNYIGETFNLANDCTCGAEQINALLAERRREAGL